MGQTPDVQKLPQEVGLGVGELQVRAEKIKAALRYYRTWLPDDPPLAREMRRGEHEGELRRLAQEYRAPGLEVCHEDYPYEPSELSSYLTCEQQLERDRLSAVIGESLKQLDYLAQMDWLIYGGESEYFFAAYGQALEAKRTAALGYIALYEHLLATVYELIEGARSAHAAGVASQAAPAGSNGHQSTAESIADPSLTPLTKTEMAVLDFLAQKGPALCKLDDIVSGIGDGINGGMGRTTACDAVKALIDAGYATRPKGPRMGAGLTDKGRTVRT